MVIRFCVVKEMVLITLGQANIQETVYQKAEVHVKLLPELN